MTVRSKGGVEGQIGYFHRNHFVPVPKVATLAELNESSTVAARNCCSRS
ncbi:hypothetical protein [Streptomyces sp. NBC_01238]